MSLTASGLRRVLLLAALAGLQTHAYANDHPTAGPAWLTHRLLSPSEVDRPTSPAGAQENVFWENGYHQTGIDGPAFGIFAFEDRLIVGGSFQQAGEAISRNIAAWDGTRWSPLGIGMNDWVVCFAEYQGSLIAGGNFSSADGKVVNHIARWDGST